MTQATNEAAVQTASTAELTHYISRSQLRHLVEQALDEDLGRGDATSDTVVPADLQATAVLRARRPGTVAGIEVATLVFQEVDASLKFETHIRDGYPIAPNEDIATIRGSARSILRGERVALNFIQRLSGIATMTARYIAAVAGTEARIVDTRKTTPGLRALEKYAVRAGGGHNHRRDLSDAVMIKDNHLVAIRARGLTLVEALAEARQALPHTIKVEVEVDRIDQIPEALEAGADIILLDNMGPDQLREAVALIDKRAMTEASGGVNLNTVAALAATGVDLISVGALTHSAPALDIGLDFIWEHAHE